MSDWTASSRVKVERAKEHVRNLESEIQAFWQRRPYEILTDDDPDPGNYIARVRAREQPPIRWGAVAGDAIHNLRSALDVLIHQLVTHATGKHPRAKLAFPIYDTRHECEAAGFREIERASKTAVGIVKALKPYKLGNEPLWLIKHLDNVDKHRVLLVVGSAFTNVRINLAAAFPDLWNLLPGLWVGLKPQLDPELCPLQDGAILFRARRDHMQMQPQFTFEIAFGEDETVRGKPIVPTLHQFADVVDGIVDQFAVIRP